MADDLPSAISSDVAPVEAVMARVTLPSGQCGFTRTVSTLHRSFALQYMACGTRIKLRNLTVEILHVAYMKGFAAE